MGAYDGAGEVDDEHGGAESAGGGAHGAAGEDDIDSYGAPALAALPEAEVPEYEAPSSYAAEAPQAPEAADSSAAAYDISDAFGDAPPAGPSWTCPACGNANELKVKKCRKCYEDRPREVAASAPGVMSRASAYTMDPSYKAAPVADIAAALGDLDGDGPGDAPSEAPAEPPPADAAGAGLLSVPADPSKPPPAPTPAAKPTPPRKQYKPQAWEVEQAGKLDRAAKARPRSAERTWQCRSCKAENAWKRQRCEKCYTERPPAVEEFQDDAQARLAWGADPRKVKNLLVSSEVSQNEADRLIEQAIKERDALYRGYGKRDMAIGVSLVIFGIILWQSGVSLHPLILKVPMYGALFVGGLSLSSRGLNRILFGSKNEGPESDVR